GHFLAVDDVQQGGVREQDEGRDEQGGRGAYGELGGEQTEAARDGAAVGGQGRVLELVTEGQGAEQTRTQGGRGQREVVRPGGEEAGQRGVPGAGQEHGDQRGDGEHQGHGEVAGGDAGG